LLSKVSEIILSRFASTYWRYRHLWDRNWAESYKSDESLKHPHRQLILKAIPNYEPIESVLEIGCGGGSNLYLIGKQYPDSYIYGYDVSPEAIRTAKTFLYKYRKHFIYKEIDAIHPVDIVLTDATAIYVSDRNIKSFIERLKKLSEKALILCEWHSDEGPCFKHGHWVHNYKNLLPGSKITKLKTEDWPESPEWQEYGHIITYETS